MNIFFPKLGYFHAKAAKIIAKGRKEYIFDELGYFHAKDAKIIAKWRKEYIFDELGYFHAKDAKIIAKGRKDTKLKHRVRLVYSLSEAKASGLAREDERYR